MAKKQWDITAVPDLVKQIYNQVLERDPDNVGLISYGCALNRGESSVRDVVGAIGLSQEYADRFITPNTIADGVKLCYNHFLARDADPDGLASQEQLALAQGMDAVITGMIGGDEYTQRFGDDTTPHP